VYYFKWHALIYDRQISGESAALNGGTESGNLSRMEISTRYETSTTLFYNRHTSGESAVLNGGTESAELWRVDISTRHETSIILFYNRWTSAESTALDGGTDSVELRQEETSNEILQQLCQRDIHIPPQTDNSSIFLSRVVINYVQLNANC